jgi:type II secretory pathway component PulF
MNQSTPTPNSNIQLEILSLATGVRSIAAVFTVVISLFGIYIAHVISNFEAIFHDMLGNKPLPYLTQFVIDYKTVLFWLAVLWPLMAIICSIAVKDHKKSLFAIAAIIGLLLLQSILILSSLFEPLTTTFCQLQSA